ncbi:MAG: hypothetical protein ACTSXA_10280 [Candidatus Heimdallarchaeota archaeon]
MGYASQLGTFSVTIKKRFISLAIPILICSALSGICSWLLYGYFTTDASGGQGAPSATFIPGDNVGPALANAAIYVGIAFIGAFGIFFIFKYGKIQVLKALFAIAIFVTCFFFVFLLVLAVPYYIHDLLTDRMVFAVRTDWIIFGIAIAVGLLYAVFTVITMVYQLVPQPAPQIMAMLFAVLSGTFLATFLPMLASIFIMIGLSIYDIISVFKGPIKKIAEVSEERETQQMEEEENRGKENLKNKIIEELPEKQEENTIEPKIESNEETLEESRLFDESEYYYTEYIELGLGDLAFFGMLFSFGLIRLGFFAAIGAFIGCVLGAIGTIKLLEKVRMMPGLPLSIGLGLIFAFAIWGILALAGYRGWGWNKPDLFSSLI